MILSPYVDKVIFDAIKKPKVPSVLVVCDGWTEPRHPRKVLREGDPEHVSHGMCEECEEAMK